MILLDAALIRYKELDSWARLSELIAAGEAEGLHLEAKAPTEPRLTKDQKEYLAKAVSGFANTAGGVILWGMSTTKHAHSGLDVLTQLEPIGDCNALLQQIQRTVPTLTTPPVVACTSKILVAKPGDTRGVIVTHIPHHPQAPVQSNSDHVFYFRSGDDFHPAPYEVIRKLFGATESPDLQPALDGRLVKREADGSWNVPLVVVNNSAAVAEHLSASVHIENPGACETIQVTGFNDASGVNPGKRIFMQEAAGVTYQHLNRIMGAIIVRMKVGKRPKRRLVFTITLFASKMAPRRVQFVVQLAKKGFSVRAAKPAPVD